ncbi:MAG: FAD-dependent oxidoreductase [Bacilli bacterium]|nr:FAD-dependent oxidoreductase [Bacilli bacterium]
MDSKYNSLFTSWKIGNVEIKNRIVMTSMGGTSLFGWMEPAKFDKEAAKFLLERAKNNVGLILPGIAPVKNPMMGGWLYSNKKMYKDLKVYMDEFHKTGAKLFVQLTAGFGRSMALNPLMEKCSTNKLLGGLMKPIFNMNWINGAPSVTPNRWTEKVMTHPLTQKQIKQLIDAFAKTAKLCKDAGVDGIEVHAVHEGYLLDQFTLKYANLRSDEYGGNFENRYRFPVEIVKAIKEVCGKDFPVSLRYSVVSKTKGFGKGALPIEGDNYTEVGRDMEESIKAANYLIDAGYDMLNCDNGTYDAWYWAHPPGYMGRNCNLKEVSELKKHVSVPVVCAGNMDADASSLAIEKGYIDAMGVARQFLVDPAWVTKLKEGKEKDIHPCIECHNGCFNMCHYKGVPNDQSLNDALHMARCALNPETMQSKKYFIKKAKKIKKVAVVGGGIGGMESAITLAKRGHNVTLFEKTNELGGVFILAAAPSFKASDRRLISWYKDELKKYPNIEIKLNTEVKCGCELLKEFNDVIIATGSKANTLKLAGSERVIEACKFLAGDMKKAGNNPIIIGGGLTGCEIAYELCLLGKKPTIIEMKNDLIAAKGVCLANSSYLRDYFEYAKTPVYLETSVKSITKDGVVVVDKSGKEFEIKGDEVISSIGYKPMPLNKKSGRIHLVGDCYSVGNLRTVIWRSWDVCMKI